MDQSAQSAAQHQARSRSFSLRSDKSGEGRTPASLSSNDKADKARRDSFLRGESKANPNAAMNEVQPGAAALLEKSTLTSIRDVQHKDADGNPITEPDLCNPTRPRWERPLDTIRSFERAIDGGYHRRSVSRADTYDSSSNQFASRRSSYFGGPDSGASTSRHSQIGGYYAGRRPESYAEHNGQQLGGSSRSRYTHRGMSDSAITRLSGPYGGSSQYGHHQSQETGLTNGSDSTGPWNNSTDPSSESSSPDRYHTGERKQHNVETYGYDSYGGGPIAEEHATDDSNAYPQRTQRGPNGFPINGGAPPVPSHTQERKPIKLGGGGGDGAFATQTGSLPTVSRPQEEKKKGFFKRRFSKKD